MLQIFAMLQRFVQEKAGNTLQNYSMISSKLSCLYVDKKKLQRWFS